MTMLCRILLVLCWLTAGGLTAAAASLAPAGGSWDVGEGLPLRKKQRLAVSGIACPPQPTAGSRCLLAVDEGTSAAFIVLGDEAFTADDASVALLDENGELDAEGAATDGDFFYISGSHAVKRTNCKANPDSHHVIRLRRDSATGGIKRNGAGNPASRMDGADLESVLAGLPALASALGSCLGADGGLDIEGIAVRGERLYFGFRGPTKNDRAFILSVAKAAFFEGEPADPVLSEVVVGPGRGIRDLQAVKDGLLILAGPNDVPSKASFTIGFWPGTGAATPPVELDLSAVKLRKHGKCQDEETKPEALAVLDETPARFRVLILSDGMCDGGPMMFDVAR